MDYQYYACCAAGMWQNLFLFMVEDKHGHQHAKFSIRREKALKPIEEQWDLLILFPVGSRLI